MPYFSLHDLDRKIEPYVDFDGGVFFEAGANNGVTYSNTAHFERDRGWTGILVEPIPVRFSEAVVNRPNSRCFNAALVAPDYPSPEIPMTYCNLMSTVADPASAIDSRVHTEKGRPILARRNEVPYSFTAPARTISSILDEAGVSHIDLMSLDIEGYEHMALKGLNHDRHHVKYICVEAVGNALDLVMASLEGRYRVAGTLSHHDFLLERV